MKKTKKVIRYITDDSDDTFSDDPDKEKFYKKY